MGEEKCGKVQQNVAIMKPSTNPHKNPLFAKSCEQQQDAANTTKMPFHGDNTGSNPVGDANRIVVADARLLQHVDPQHPPD
jgi:hypothetical protein